MREGNLVAFADNFKQMMKLSGSKFLLLCVYYIYHLQKTKTNTWQWMLPLTIVYAHKYRDKCILSYYFFMQMHIVQMRYDSLNYVRFALQ